MAEKQLQLTYKIYMEAEDVAQTRIISSTAFVKNLFKNCGNSYFKETQIDDESDLDDFVLRLYAEKELAEDVCSAPADAKTFLGDMAEFLDNIAQAQSYMDMEGSFSIHYEGKEETYRFVSEAGNDYCDFTPQ